jgi:hypothetical protein
MVCGGCVAHGECSCVEDQIQKYIDRAEVAEARLHLTEKGAAALRARLESEEAVNAEHRRQAVRLIKERDVADFRAKMAEAALREVEAIINDLEHEVPDETNYHVLIYRIRDRIALTLERRIPDWASAKNTLARLPVVPPKTEESEKPCDPEG